MELEHLKLESTSGAQINLDALYKICPACFTETRDEQTGEMKHIVNFETLRTLLGDDTVEDTNEAYEFNWVGKQEARREVARPIKKTLRPVPEDSVDWDNTENLYIEGDNLEVLKLLQKSYLGKVKMIYIDPPYNTGNDFVYDDDFSQSQAEYDEAAGNVDELGNRFRKNTDTNGKFHSDWCSMIYSRLAVARSLLTEDGIIFISINDKEIENLKKICKEIFGEHNEIATLIWDKNHSAQAGIYKVYHEYIIVFSKNKGKLNNPTSIENDIFEAGAMKKVSGRHPATCFTFPKGTRFEAEDETTFDNEYGDEEKVQVVNGKIEIKDRKLVNDVTLKAGWTQANQMKQFFYGDRQSLVDTKNQKIIDFYFNSKGKIKIVKKRSAETPQTTCKFGTQSNASIALANLFELPESPFSSPKPLSMLEDFINRFTTNDDIILDFFSGSATTAHAVFSVNSSLNKNRRKFILIQLEENLDLALKTAQKDAVRTLETAIEFLTSKKLPHMITEIGKERIRRAGKKIKEELAAKKQQEGIFADQEEETKLDTGFRVLRLDESNMNKVYFTPKSYRQDQLDLFLDNVKNDRTDLDLLFGCMLDWGVQLSLPMAKETVDGCDIWTVNEGDMVACFSEKISQKVIDVIADKAPLRVIFRDSSFSADDSKINIYETFKQKLDWTDDEVFKNVKVI